MKWQIKLILIYLIILNSCTFNRIKLNIHNSNELTISDHWDCDYADFKAYRLSIAPIIDFTDKWSLEFETHTSKHNTDANEYGLNLILERYIYKNTYLGLIAGLSYLDQDRPQVDWGDSGLLGTLGLTTGYDYYISDSIFLNIESRINHTSDPLTTHEFGRNFGSLSIGIGFKF